MSRGPGKIEQAIAGAFTERQSEFFTVAALAIIAYPGLNEPLKKHRVSVVRAADKVAARLWWAKLTSERPGGHIVYCNTLDVRSYTLGRLRADFVNNDLSDIALEALIEPPTEQNPYAHRTRWEWMQPGAAWWTHVETARARQRGDTVEADRLLAELETDIGRKWGRLSMGSCR
ncbi:hypothetical protein [Methylobacterium sp. J-068]|uniref:hypothetical protein n=1 Tax=Methylobacterium sp. J-068 TaxID=2836649 RepID=UPI001FBA6616|nr:hypothetical protein [Methylobacterium sp. J-068]MCJ2036422.1 hypothetical protein [Methylobacterium sp. J-068]